MLKYLLIPFSDSEYCHLRDFLLGKSNIFKPIQLTDTKSSSGLETEHGDVLRHSILRIAINVLITSLPLTFYDLVTCVKENRNFFRREDFTA